MGWKCVDWIELAQDRDKWRVFEKMNKYEGWNFNSGNYLFTTDTK